MSYIAFAWITTLLYSASGLVGKFAANHKIQNVWLYNFVWSLVVVLISCGAALAFGVGWPTDWNSLVIAGLLSAVTAVTYTYSVYLLDVSVLSSLYTLRTPVSVLLGALWFGESFGLWQLGLIVLMTVAGMFVSVDERMSVRSFFRKPIAFALFTVTLSAFYNASVKSAVAANSYWTTVFWYNLINQIFLLSTIPFFWKERKRVTIGDVFPVSLSAVLAGIGGMTVIPAIMGNLGITMAILTLPLTLVASIVLSFVAPKLLESHTPKVYAIRFVSAVVMFACAVSLSVR